MTSTTRQRIALVLAISSLLAAMLWWLARGRSSRAARAKPGPTLNLHPSPGLDVAAFRARAAERRAVARELQRRHPRPPASEGKPLSHLGTSMLEPYCILGPVDVCASIADSVYACSDGDGQACLAVGQYLQDAPPRPLVALSFFHYACKSGEQAGCDRMAELKAPMTDPPAPCEDDPLACAWQALRSKDVERFDHACSLGVADACAYMIQHHEDDPPRARAYLETACQLGNPMACDGLGQALSPDCREDCYPPDAEAAIAASTIACDVGFAAACARLPQR